MRASALLAAELQSAQSPMVVVDMNSGFGNAQFDGIHPDVAGAQRDGAALVQRTFAPASQSGSTGNTGAENSGSTASAKCT